MDKKEFIEYVKSLPDVQDMINKYNPYIIYLGGSRSVAYNTDESDYDLISIIPNNIDLPASNFKINNDKGSRIHMMTYKTHQLVDNIIDNLNPYCHIFIILGFVSRFGEDPSNWIYSRKTPESLELIWNNMNLITEQCVYQLINRLHLELKHCSNDCFLHYSSKVYYQLLVAYDIMCKTDSSKLIHVLRSKKVLSDSEKEEFKNKMKYLYNFYESYRQSKYDFLNAKLEVIEYGNNSE